MGVAAVAEGFHDREVGVGQGDVLADQADADRAGGRLHPGDERLPRRRSRGVPVGVEAEQLADVVVQAFLVQSQGDLVQVGGVHARDDGLDRDVAQERNLALEAGGDAPVAAADDDVGLDAPAAQLGDGVLGRLGLLLARTGPRYGTRVTWT